MTTKSQMLMTLGALELISFVMIAFVWKRRTDLWWPTKLFWTLFLLVPLLGPVIYGFVATNPRHTGKIQIAPIGTTPSSSSHLPPRGIGKTTRLVLIQMNGSSHARVYTPATEITNTAQCIRHIQRPPYAWWFSPWR